MEKIHGRNQRFRKKRHAKKSIDVLEDGLTDESRVNCQDVEGRDSSGQGSSKKKSSATRGKVSFEKKKNLAPRVLTIEKNLAYFTSSPAKTLALIKRKI